MYEIMTSSNISQNPFKKRSIFNKQALAKVNVDKNPVDFFSRAKKVYPKLLEEEENKRLKKISEAKSQRSKKLKDLPVKDFEEVKNITSSSAALENQTNSQGSLVIQSSWTSPSSPKAKRSVSPRNSGCTGSLQSSNIKLRSDSSNKKRKLLSLENISKNIISLDSDDEETPPQSTPHAQKNASINPPSFQSSFSEGSDIFDEEYPELIQQAREREKLKAQKRMTRANYTTGPSLHTSPEKAFDIFDTELRSVLELDPVVELLITSEIEGTRPLRVKRKLSQRLKEARITWCDKQHVRTDKMGRPLEEVVFFTWGGKRVFDVTTCGSLGLKMNKEGKILLSKGDTDCGFNIHLEAWTDDTLREKEKIVLRNQELEIGKRDIREAEIQSDREKNPSYKLILKAKDMEPYKLFVKPTTTIAKMVEAFRNVKAIPESTKISLRFDGDLLDPNSTIQETELGDPESVDTVEVYIK